MENKNPEQVNEQDYFFMRRAIDLAKEGKSTKNAGPFGAVVVRDGTVVVEGFNTVGVGPDCTQHAELAVIQKACLKLGSKTLENCTLYTSCEPCMMCLGAIKWSKLKVVYFGASASDAKDNAFVYSKMYYDSDMNKRHSEFNMKQLLAEEAILVWH